MKKASPHRRDGGTDLQRLRESLKKIAFEKSSITEGWREVAPPRSGDLLAALLLEIDETMVPRKISLCNVEGQVLHFQAGNRRLLRFLSPAPLSGYAKLFEQDLPDAEDGALAVINKMLRAYFGDSPAFGVRTVPLGEGDASRHMGLSAQALARAWSIPLQDLAAASPGRVFNDAVAEFGALARHWVRVKAGDVVETSGPEVSVGWIAACVALNWQDILSISEREAAASTEPKCCIFGSGPDEDSRFAVAIHGDVSFCFSCAADSLTEVAEVWQRNLKSVAGPSHS